jgi:N-acetylglutamate synthase-like GNAT family acetyltransferase
LGDFELVEPDDREYAEYSAHFGDFNKLASGWHVQTYSIVRRDQQRIVAGCRGHVYLGALEVRGLWVDEALRGSGIGTELLHAMEQEARNRGASKAMLYTYSWQAEVFYRKHGYQEFARFDFPEGHYRIDMQKML